MRPNSVRTPLNDIYPKQAPKYVSHLMGIFANRLQHKDFFPIANPKNTESNNHCRRAQILQRRSGPSIMPNSPSEGRATARGWTMPSHERACEPQKWDILFGRTNESINHVGNVTFRTVVGISLIAYETLPTSFRAYRHEFLVSVVESIKRGNGRFLKKNDAGGWIEVYDEKAREKVRQQYHNSIIKPHIMQAFMAVDNLSSHLLLLSL